MRVTLWNEGRYNFHNAGEININVKKENYRDGVKGSLTFQHYPRFYFDF